MKRANSFLELSGRIQELQNEVNCMNDSKDRNVEQAHERTRRLVVETNTENVPDSSQIRSVHESETFNVGDEVLRERKERSVADHDVSHRSRTTLIDNLFNEIHNKTKPTTRSVRRPRK